MKFAMLAILALLLNTSACLNNDFSASVNQENILVSNHRHAGETSTANNRKDKNVNNENLNREASKQKVEIKSQNSNKKPSFDELQDLVSNHIGNFIVINSYNPFFLEGDFNGDGRDDIGIVIGAQDRHGENGDLGDISESLCFASVDITHQNMRTGAIVFARPKQSCASMEAQRKKFKTEYSQYGLLVILGDQNGWRETFKHDAFGRKYLLLDAVFNLQADKSSEKTANLILVKKNKSEKLQPVDRNCLPVSARGDGIFSGEIESGGKVIYYDGKKFGWTQCGD